MPKRKLDVISEEEVTLMTPVLKNSLDSDEEDDEAKEDSCNIMHENDFEGVEDGPSHIDKNSGFTPFNMKEELEEGHFDKEGHYHWKKEKGIRDNWLDNIDWVKVESKPNADREASNKDNGSDRESEGSDFMFHPTLVYKQILTLLKPGETVSKALCRLGGGKKKLSTAERWKRKKDLNIARDEDRDSATIVKLTELANELLTRLGNMDIYHESYEQIESKTKLSGKHSFEVEAELDMFSDDFESKEKDHIDNTNPPVGAALENSSSVNQENSSMSDEVGWELKWSQEEDAEVHGPHTSEQMYKWSREGFFKKGAWVRKSGQDGEFCTASRIDFELYL